MTAAFGGIVD